MVAKQKSHQDEKETFSEVIFSFAVGKTLDTVCCRHHCPREILCHQALQTHAWTAHGEQNFHMASPIPEWRGLCNACSKEGSWLLGRSIADLSWWEPDLHGQGQSPGQGGRVPHACACHFCSSQAGPELFVSVHPIISDKFRAGKPSQSKTLLLSK